MSSRRKKPKIEEALPEAPPEVPGLVWGSSTEPTRINWLWPGLLPADALTVVQGRKGSGKSSLCAAMAAAVSGGPVPPGWTGRRDGRVAWYCPEESWEAAILPRLLAAGASADRVCRLRLSDGEGRPRPLSLPRDCDALRSVLRMGEIALLVIDPYGSCIGVGLSVNQDQHVRLAFEPLLDVLWECSCASIVTQHLRKGTSGDVTEHGAGSGAIVNLSRSCLRLDRHPHERERYLLSSVARNFGRPLPSQVYALRDGGNELAKVDWLGVSDMDADTIAEGRGSEAERDEWSEADRLLALLIRNSWVCVSQILREAEAAGVSPRTLRKAKARLQIPSRRKQQGQEGFWEWGPPRGGFPAQIVECEERQGIPPNGEGALGALLPKIVKKRGKKSKAPKAPSSTGEGGALGQKEGQKDGNGETTSAELPGASGGDRADASPPPP